MFSKEPHCHYNLNPLAEVICQLRFPEILKINTTPPAEFQEMIRSEFPYYTAHEESPKKLNYQFTSSDRKWRVNLTSTFISLSCAQYTDWTAFAGHLDKPLAAFIQAYSPVCFERIGLRYMNFISRKALNIESTPFSELIQPVYLGILSEEDVVETSVLRSSVDTELTLRNHCKVKIHAGLGMVKRNGQTDNEVKFIFDQDIYTHEQTFVNYAAAAIETLHSCAFPIFRGAITNFLHNSMDPEFTR